jgi:hypothetical protein
VAFHPLRYGVCMNTTRFIPLVFLLCSACSPDPTGLYKNQSGSESYDFRSDSTVKFSSSSSLSLPMVGIITTTGDGKGNWSIQDNKLVYEGVSVFTGSSSGVPDNKETNETRVEFVFENNGDLITVPGEAYTEAVRFIKQR